jgi:2-polyprenyl-3-methyl-5-hydroxy-6-metoxy-1,4-benzoquinol methylase
VSYDAEAAAAFFDAYGEREWLRFEDGRTPSTSAATHTHYLHRFVHAGDRVLDAGCGPGRFTIELARIGARVTAADVSSGQLELHRRYVSEAGLEEAVEGRTVADVLDLSTFVDDEFDVTVCYGGALSYVLDEAPRAVAELARVTRPNGHVLVSVMALVGSTLHALDGVLDVARTYGPEAVQGVTSTGFLPEQYGGHLPMKLYRWRELAALLASAGEVVAASATGLFRDAPDHADLLEELELDLGREPGAIDAGRHILAVVRI